MQEILPGLIRWTAVHPRIGVEVASHLVIGSGTMIDPLLPEEGIEALSGRHIERVVLSNRHHLRDSQQVAEHFKCPVLCHESGLHEFENGPEVQGYAFGDRLADDVVALEMDAICPDDAVLRIEVSGGALLFADSLINYSEVGFVPDDLIGDDADGVKSKIRGNAAELLSETFEHLLFAHGEPRLADGRDALRTLAEG